MEKQTKQANIKPIMKIKVLNEL